MTFSNQLELRTLDALRRGLEPLGYTVSQKTRVLDAVEAAADNPQASAQAGPTLADMFLPAMREIAGPLRPAHPWLRPGDIDYAFRAHFDFIVHAPTAEGTGTHPLLAVECDGPGHNDPRAREHDHRKNRLCAASGLPLLRVDDSYLARRDRVVLVTWLMQMWAANRAEMPRMLEERDAEVAEMTEAEREHHGPFLLCERPDLDVAMIFRLEHPFPPTATLASRLARRYGLTWWLMPRDAAPEGEPRWQASGAPPTFHLRPGLVETWSCDVTLQGPEDRAAELRGMVDVRTAYPFDNEPPQDGWAAFLAGRLPALPAGPWIGAPDVIGEALCLHNTLVEIESWLHRHAMR